MTETFKIILTSSLTIIGGILVYSFGQIIQKFFIEPIQEQRKVIGEIADTFLLYTDLYINPYIITTKNKIDTAESLRNLSKSLISRTYIIPLYNFLTKLKIVIEKTEIEKAAKKMIAVSNLMHKYITDGKPDFDPHDKIDILDSIQEDEIVDAMLEITSLLNLAHLN